MKFWPLIIALILVGCVPAQKGGRSTFSTPSGITGSVIQSQNPKTDTTQVMERITEVTTPNGIVTRTTEKLNTKIGAAQKDTAREVGAKLASLKSVVWVGILLFIAGVASFAWPPLRAIIGSATTSALMCLAGVALIALPSLIVGNELLIMAVGIGAVALYWFSHRHGELRGKLNQILK